MLCILIFRYISPGFLRNRDLGDVIGGGGGWLETRMNNIYKAHIS